MKRFWILLLMLILVACSTPGAEEFTQKTNEQGVRPTLENAPATKTISPTGISEIQLTASPTVSRSSYEDFGPAPELENEIWINTEFPLRLSDLRGQVVLIEMWTFG